MSSHLTSMQSVHVHVRSNRPNFVTVDTIASPLKHPRHRSSQSTSSTSATGAERTESMQKRLRRKRKARRDKLQAKAALTKQQQLAQIHHHLPTTVASPTHVSDDDAKTSSSSSCNDMSDAEGSHSRRTARNSGYATDGSTYSKRMKLPFTWLFARNDDNTIPAQQPVLEEPPAALTSLEPSVVSRVYESTKSVLQRFTQPWRHATQLEEQLKRLEEEMIALKQQMLAQPAAPSMNSAPAAPPMAPPSAPPMAPPMAPSMSGAAPPPPPPPPGPAFIAPSALNRPSMLAGLGSIQLKKASAAGNDPKKPSSLADISAADLLAVKLKPASSSTPARNTRSSTGGPGAGLDLSQIMSVKLRSTPARDMASADGAAQRIMVNGMMPMIGLSDINSVKLKRSVMDRSPGGTPRIKKTTTATNGGEDGSNATSDAFLFNQLKRKFHADPRSQLYEGNKENQSSGNALGIPMTPWTTTKTSPKPKVINLLGSITAVAAEARRRSKSKSPAAKPLSAAEATPAVAAESTAPTASVVA